MSALKLSTRLHPDQTIASFLSNLAANNGAQNMYLFCHHMGFIKQPNAYSGRSILSPDYLNLNRIAELGGVLAEDLAGGVVERLNKHWAIISGQKIWHKDIAYEQFRHCPACVNEDLENGKGPKELRSPARLWWLVKTVEACPVHNVRLVCSSRDCDRLLSGDFAHYLRSNQDEVLTLYDGREQALPSPVDEYQFRRLKGARTSPFLDSLPFSGAIELCELVGGMDLSGSSTFRRNIATLDRLREARERGFAILDAGIDSFSEFIERTFSGMWTGRRACNRRVYGSLYSWLSPKANDQDFWSARNALEVHARANLPLAPDDKFFFKTIERRMHSFRSLADKLSSHYTLVEKLLIAGGFTTAEEIARTNARLLFDANEVEKFFHELRERRTVTLAGEFLQLTPVAIEKLVAAGYITLKPLLGDDGVVRLRCSRDELEVLQKRVTSRAAYRERRQEHMFNIYYTAAKTGCLWMDVFQLLVDGLLENLIYSTFEPTIGSLRLDLDEVRSKLDRRKKRLAAAAYSSNGE